MISATIPIIINTGINRCRTAVATTTTITVVVTVITVTMIAINTIMIIISSTRLLLLLVYDSFLENLSKSTNPIMTTMIISINANVCVNSSDRSSTTATIVVVMVSINIKFITNYCGSYQY